MHAWILDPFPIGDRRLPHRSFPPRYVDVAELKQLGGVACFKVDMDDLISVNKRVAIIRNDYKIVNVDLLRIDPELLKTQKNLIDEMYKPVTKTSEPLIHLVTGGEIYYDILVENNNNDEEDPQWIRILLVRGDFIIIPVGKTFRSTTTGTNFVRAKRFHQEQNRA